MNMKRILLIVAALLVPALAMAQPARNAFIDCSITTSAMTGTASLMLPSSMPHNVLQFQNIGSANVGYSFQTSTPNIGTYGTYTLAAGALVQWMGAFVPLNQIYVVGASSSVPISCSYN